MNVLEPVDIKWRFVSSLACSDCHYAKYLNEEFGLEMERETKVVDYGCGFAKPKTYYYITGHDKEYTDLQKLCDDWNEMKNYDDPNDEITWIKVTKKK